MLKVKRYATYWCWMFFAVGIPAILINEKYGIFKKVSNNLELTGGGIILLIFLLFFGKDQIKKWVQELPDSAIKNVMANISIPFALFVMYAVLLWAEVQIDTLQFIMLASAISNIIALIFEVYHLKYKKECKEKGGVINE